MPKPALFTRTSTRRPRWAISSANRSRSRSSAKSAAITSARTPWRSDSSEASPSRRCSRRATIVTPCPRRARPRANSAPMPDDAPVTSAVELWPGSGSAMPMLYPAWAERNSTGSGLLPHPCRLKSLLPRPIGPELNGEPATNGPNVGVGRFEVETGGFRAPGLLVQHYHRVVASCDEPLGDETPVVPHPRLVGDCCQQPLVALVGAGVRKLPMVLQLDLRVNDLKNRVEVALPKCLIGPAHEVDVLLGHHPRSIAASRTVSQLTGLRPFCRPGRSRSRSSCHPPPSPSGRRSCSRRPRTCR